MVHRLDATGLVCPAPVLRARRALNGMKTGDVLEVRATDRAGIHDFPAFCATAGHHLLMAREEGDVIVFQIEKGEPEELDLDAADAGGPSPDVSS